MTTLKGCLKDLLDSDRLVSATDVEALRAMCIKEITESNCNEPDKRKMVMQLKTMNSVKGIQQYIVNAFLKFNGLGCPKNLNYRY